MRLSLHFVTAGVSATESSYLLGVLVLKPRPLEAAARLLVEAAMGAFYRAAMLAACPLMVVASTGIVQAHPAPSAQEITSAIRGKICTTSAGAKFAFGSDGRFAYDGLWQSSGSYIVASNAIVVTFDSGLKRAFAISIRDGALYMEQTLLSCAANR